MAGGIPRQERAFFQSQRIDQQPDTITPPTKVRRPLPGMRDYTQPTPHEQHLSEVLDCLLETFETNQLYLKAQLQQTVQTLDTVVYEHDTQELPTTQNFFQIKLQPQTSQIELITGIFVAIVMPGTVSNTVITLDNAYAQLGPDYVNLNSVLNSQGAMGGMVPGLFSWVLRSDDIREATLVATQNWPAGAYMTFILFGTAIPATLGDVLH